MLLARRVNKLRSNMDPAGPIEDQLMTLVVFSSKTFNFKTFKTCDLEDSGAL